MGVEFCWRIKQGQRTGDNRDYCGIGMRSDAVLCIVLDGSTSGANSGELVQHITSNLIDWFMDVAGRVSADAIIDQLGHIHKDLAPKFWADSASYVIALIEDEKPALVLHAGDCLAGRYDGKAPVCWLTRPHTLANAIEDMLIADIAATPIRNRLTRSFRVREFLRPDVSEVTLDGEHNIILATDGFWAELDPNEQSRFLTGDDLPVKDDGDDCSVLEICKLAGMQDSTISGQTSENLYIADSRRSWQCDAGFCRTVSLRHSNKSPLDGRELRNSKEKGVVQ